MSRTASIGKSCLCVLKINHVVDSLSWTFTPVGDGTRIDFSHSDWGVSGPAGEIGKGWDHFIATSLKFYLDTGEGAPWE